MANWRKRLQHMVDDPKPVNYRYREAASILRRLGFELAGGQGSHRLWRLEIPGGSVPVSLVDEGHGPMKSVYVKKMIQQLREHGLLPATET